MTHPFRLLVCAGILSFFLLPCMSAQDDLSPELEPLRPYISKTWVAPVGTSPDGVPMIDISRWERALNGKAVRVLHSVNQGIYGGETIFTWDASESTLVFYYFTTAGFFTHGTTVAGPEGLKNVENVVGNTDGITKVESTVRITDDGNMLVVSRMYKNGAWEEPEEATYTEDPSAKVVFR
jgi:hypothetical protein